VENTRLKEANKIDHVLVSLRQWISVTDVKSSRRQNGDTDHYLVKTTVREGIVCTQKMEGANPKKWDIQKPQEIKEIKQKVSDKK
jgi:hypothetical protein